MATTINADTSTGGVVLTGDGSGVLELQAAGVTKATLNSSGMTLATPLAVASGGTGTTSAAFVSLTTNVTGTLPIANGGTGTTSTTFANLTTNVTGTLPIANGGTNSTATATAGGAGYGTGTAHAYTAAGTSGQLLQSNGASAPAWATVSAGYTLGTSVATTSGTSVTFTGIPAGTKNIIVSFFGVSTNGTTAPQIRLGAAGVVESTSYDSRSMAFNNNPASGISTSTSGFVIHSLVASSVMNGSVNLTLENSATYKWVASGTLTGVLVADNGMIILAGQKTLTAELDRVQITISPNTFDAGEINIAYI